MAKRAGARHRDQQPLLFDPDGLGLENPKSPPIGAAGPLTVAQPEPIPVPDEEPRTQEVDSPLSRCPECGKPTNLEEKRPNVRCTACGCMMGPNPLVFGTKATIVEIGPAAGDRILGKVVPLLTCISGCSFRIYNARDNCIRPCPNCNGETKTFVAAKIVVVCNLCGKEVERMAGTRGECPYDTNGRHHEANFVEKLVRVDPKQDQDTVEEERDDNNEDPFAPE